MSGMVSDPLAQLADLIGSERGKSKSVIELALFFSESFIQFTT